MEGENGAEKQTEHSEKKASERGQGVRIQWGQGHQSHLSVILTRSDNLWNLFGFRLVPNPESSHLGADFVDHFHCGAINWGAVPVSETNNELPNFNGVS